MNVVERVKQGMLERHVDNRISLGWKRLRDFSSPVAEGELAPEIVGPEKAALEHVVAQLPGFGFVEERTARFGHHHERTVIEQRIGQSDDDMLIAVFRVAADGRRGELREPERQVDVGSRVIDAPAVAVAVRGVPKEDAAEEKVAVEV